MSKISAVVIYTVFLLLSIAPILADIVIRDPDLYMNLLRAIFFGIHSIFLSWFFTGSIIVAICSQIRETTSRPSHGLSLAGLAAQALVFTLVAISWTMRLSFPWHQVDHVTPELFPYWYEFFGWAAVDNAIFALVQAILPWITSRRPVQGSDNASGETEPLLRALRYR